MRSPLPDATFLISLLMLAMGLCLCPFTRALEPCCIRIVDKSNGWPVPAVELTTTHHVRLVSDNAGVIAFDLPELMNVATWFSVRGHGYTVNKDGFGFEGVRLTPRSGETLTIELDRQLPGKRLGRITGGGIFAESQKLGRELDWREQGILGCDSVQNVEHNGRLHWGWGDTIVPGYPLGIFHMTGATTKLQPLDSFEPPVRLRYEYFADNQKPRGIAELPGEGPTWLSGYASVVDKSGQSHLVATYAKIKPPLDAYEYGLCEWDDVAQRFVRHQVMWKADDKQNVTDFFLLGHSVPWTDESGKSWLLFGDPFPSVKCENNYESWANPRTWTRLDPQSEVPALRSQEMVKPHRGAIAWNAFRRKWVAIFTQFDGKRSHLGEIWYAEADLPTGPWSHAVHVVTHDKYTFYNPQLHAGFTPEKSPLLLFEATYTKEFSGNESPTPRHDYNQMLYRLDLDEPAFDF